MSSAFDTDKMKLDKMHRHFVVDRVEINRNLCYNIIVVF